MKGVTLIGMPGAGKSTVGKLLAEKLSYKFVDLDLLIKEKEKKSHAEILEEEGEAALLAAEENYTLGLDLARTVFSPGGSIVYSPRAMEKLKKETAIIYLAMPLEKICRRLGNHPEERGIVGFKEKGIEKLFQERTPLYQSFAHYTIDRTNLGDQGAVAKCYALLQHQ